jgi:hypothetical protein
MGILARDSPLKQQLTMEAWLEQLLFIAADASARHDWPLASRALDGFSVCLDCGGGADAPRMASALAATNALPLLRRLWAEKDAMLGRAVAGALAVLSERETTAPGSFLFFWCFFTLFCC